MRRKTRIIFSVYVALISVACVFIIVAAFDASIASGIMNIVSYIYPFNFWTVVWIIVAALFLVVGIAMLFFRTSSKDKGKNAVIATVEGGSVSITVDALKEFVNRYLAGIEGIVVSFVDIQSVNVGIINIRIGISVNKEIIIPEITAKIKDEVKAYVSEYTGLNIGQVDIDVLPVEEKPQALTK